MLLDVGGQDATEAFEDVGHSDEAREILDGLIVGNLKRVVRLTSRTLFPFSSYRHSYHLARTDPTHPSSPTRSPTPNLNPQINPFISIRRKVILPPKPQPPRTSPRDPKTLLPPPPLRWESVFTPLSSWVAPLPSSPIGICRRTSRNKAH